MVKGAKFINVDFLIQIVIGTIYISSVILGVVVQDFLLFALLLQLLIGGWQLISAIVMVLLNKDMKRRIYLSIVFVYFVLGGGISSLISFRLFDDFNSIFYFVFIGLIPFCLAIWYFRITWETYQYFANRSSLEIDPTFDMDNILDSQELGKNKEN